MSLLLGVLGKEGCDVMVSSERSASEQTPGLLDTSLSLSPVYRDSSGGSATAPAMSSYPASHYSSLATDRTPVDTKPFLWNSSNYPEHKYGSSPGICSPTSVAPDSVCAPVTPHQVTITNPPSLLVTTSYLYSRQPPGTQPMQAMQQQQLTLTV